MSVQLKNFELVENEEKEGDNSTGKKKLEMVGLSAPKVREIMSASTGEWPARIDHELFVPDRSRPLWLRSTADVFGWLQTVLQNGDANAIQWATRGIGMVSQSEYVAYLQQTVKRYEAVETCPHEPPFKDHYYMHPEIQGGDGRALCGLIGAFRPATDEDRDLIRAFFLTLAWGGPCGQRPAFLFTGCDGDSQMGRGVGKTTLVNMAARLFGGTFDIRPADSWQDTIARLLTDTACEQRLALIDNIKAMRFSWANLESLVTCPTINGKRMYYGDGRRPNTLTIALTLNGASLSKDMAQRCVIVKLDRPDHAGSWESDTAAYVEANRWAIIGDLIAQLKRPAAKLRKFSRWSTWERDVLARLPEPERLQSLLQERRDAVDDDQDEADLIREAIIAELKERGEPDPDTAGVKIPASMMTEIVNAALGERLSVTAAGTKLKMFVGAIPELDHGKIGGKKLWKWKGKSHRGNLREIGHRLAAS